MVCCNTDQYQARYLAHIARKRVVTARAGEELPRPFPRRHRGNFWDVISSRRSERWLSPERLGRMDLLMISNAINRAPTSCDRHAVSVVLVERREDVEALDGLLVGGHGWLYRAGAVLLFFADPVAYKSAAEKATNPWLDAGAACMTAAYTATSLGLGSCWVNPNVRDREAFDARFNPDRLIFGSALALGYIAEHSPVAPGYNAQMRIHGQV